MTILGIDHVIILGEDLDTLSTRYRELGFTVTPGGRHAVGTHNALIPFADGSYIELLAFWQMGLGSHRRYELLQKGGGLVEFMLTSDDIETDVTAANARGASYGEPVPGSRTRPDGLEVAWLDGPPSGDGGSGLPYLIQDVTDRSLRVPDGEARRHPNETLGIDSLVLAVADLEATARRYQALLGSEPISSDADRAVAFGIGSHRLELRQPTTVGEMADHLDLFGDSPFALTLRGSGPRSFEPEVTGRARISVVNPG